jgi:hypothetical protein
LSKTFSSIRIIYWFQVTCKIAVYEPPEGCPNLLSRIQYDAVFNILHKAGRLSLIIGAFWEEKWIALTQWAKLPLSK